MAFALQTNPVMASGSSSTITKAGMSSPASSYFLVFSVVAATTGLTFGTPTDNGTGTGWNVFPNTPVTFGGAQIGLWYKQATSGDSSLTQVSVTASSVSSWNATMCSFTGFSGPTTASLDLSSTNSTGSNVTTLSTSLSQTPLAASELSFGFAIGSTSMGAFGTCQYSPNGGTTNYTLNLTQFSLAGIQLFYAFPTVSGSSPTWTYNWTNSVAAHVYGWTFYDNAPAISAGVNYHGSSGLL